jgi:hypothetical protein
MSFLGQEDDSTVFRCPRCDQFISSNVETCRFCELPITKEMKAHSAAAQFEEDKAFRTGFHKNIFIVGAVMLVIGVLMLGWFAVSMLVLGRGDFFYISPILTLLGAGQIIAGLHGMYKEKRLKPKGK